MSRRLQSSPQGSETDSWSDLDQDEIPSSPEPGIIEPRPLRLRSTADRDRFGRTTPLPLLHLDDRFPLFEREIRLAQEATRVARDTNCSKHLDGTSAHQVLSLAIPLLRF
jgi:hypothetical protein